MINRQFITKQLILFTIISNIVAQTPSYLPTIAPSSSLPTISAFPTLNSEVPPTSDTVTSAPTSIVDTTEDINVSFRIKALAIFFAVLGLIFCGFLVHFIYARLSIDDFTDGKHQSKV